MYDQKKKVLLMDMAKEIRYDAVYLDFLSKRDIDILTNIGIPDLISPYITIVSEEKLKAIPIEQRRALVSVCSLGLISSVNAK